MNINVLLIVLLVLCAWRAWRGYKNGMAEEVRRLVSWIALLFVLALIIMIVTSYKKNDTRNVVIAVIILLITGILLHLIGIVMRSLKAIAELPVIGLFNSLLGIAVGIAEVVTAAWIMYYLLTVLPTGSFGEQIIVWTNENEWLMKLYESNHIMKLLTGA